MTNLRVLTLIRKFRRKQKKKTKSKCRQMESKEERGGQQKEQLHVFSFDIFPENKRLDEDLGNAFRVREMYFHEVNDSNMRERPHENYAWSSHLSKNKHLEECENEIIRRLTEKGWRREGLINHKKQNMALGTITI